MQCPYCGSSESFVSETRDSTDLNTIRRRRTCINCTKRFTTYERVESVHLTVLKKSGRRDQFSREKLKAASAMEVSGAMIDLILHRDKWTNEVSYKECHLFD